MTVGSGFTIRPLDVHEWQTFKELRIAALTESPDSFGPTAAEAMERPDDAWRDVVRTFAGADRRLFIALRERAPIGLISAAVDSERTGHLGAMWVAPDARGLGAGRRLFDAACGWLSSRGCRTLALWVTEGNDRAISLYERSGFTLTGVTRPLRDGSPLLNVEMSRRIGD